MAAIKKNGKNEGFPGRFEDLVAVMAPEAIADEKAHRDTVDLIDRLMALETLTRGQERYLETLVQLVEAYEARHCPVDTSDISGLDSLRHLLEENRMNASDLAALLGVHPSMGSKILKGQRALTAGHLWTLAERFKVSPALFMGSSSQPGRPRVGPRGAHRKPGARQGVS